VGATYVVKRNTRRRFTCCAILKRPMWLVSRSLGAALMVGGPS
jgi:hypothetical protein